MKLQDIAARIDAHLKRFENNPKINVPSAGNTLHPYYWARAWAAGSRVGVVYITFQGPTYLTKVDAERYLAWLDDRHVGSHHEMPRKGRSR
jgi:hypothetical protein